jgi:hypothetical protein
VSWDNTIHVPENLRSRRCECDRPIHDAGSCIRCGKRIAVEALIAAGALTLAALDELTPELVDELVLE